MVFVNDLDALAWAAMFAAILVSFAVTFLNVRDWRNHWTVDFGNRLPVLLYLGVALIVGACDSYSPDANAPRKTVQGVARFVTETNGKGGYSKYICVTDCERTGGYALKLHGRDATAVKTGYSYVFTYLERPIGNAVTGVSLRAIQASEPESGRTVYQLDLTNHPYQVAAYLCDLALLVCSGLIGKLLRNSQREHLESANSDEGGSDQNRKPPKGEGPISLGLESKDAR